MTHSSLVRLIAFSSLLLAIPGALFQIKAQKKALDKPVYKVDPFWPKPLPNKWSMQQIVDIYVDKDDHIWVINRRSDARPDELGATNGRPNAACSAPRSLNSTPRATSSNPGAVPTITKAGPDACRRWASIAS